MYGQGQAVSARPEMPGGQTSAPRAIERVSDIQNETINLLEACKRSLDHLLGKTLGPRPEESGNMLNEPPSLLADAKRANILGHQLQSRLEELHAVVGHDKQ